MGIRDFFKFYFIYLITGLTVWAVFYGYTQWSLDAFSFDENSLTIKRPDLDYDKAMGDLWMIMKLFPLIPLGLAFFSTFFSLPPKKMKRFIVAALAVSLIGNFPVMSFIHAHEIYKDVETPMALSIFSSIVCALVLWLLSIVWYRYRNRLARAC